MSQEYYRPSNYWYDYPKDKKKPEDRLKGCFYGLWGIIILLILASLLNSCKSIQYVPVPEYHYETIVKTDSFIQRDSLYYYDSIYVDRSGDTILKYVTKIVYKDKWRTEIQIDSVLKTDSIKVPYPVEKKLTKWQKLKMDIGGFLFVFFILLTLFFVVWFILKYKRKIKAFFGVS